MSASDAVDDNVTARGNPRSDFEVKVVLGKVNNVYKAWRKVK